MIRGSIRGVSRISVAFACAWAMLSACATDPSDTLSPSPFDAGTTDDTAVAERRDAERPDAQAGGDGEVDGRDLPITVIAAIENGGMDQDSVDIQGADTLTPTIYIDRRKTPASGTGNQWRHAAFAVENAKGKTPLFRINRSTKDGNAIQTSTWRPVYTVDFVHWVQSDTVTFDGGASGTFEFSFSDPLPAGRVYIASNLYGRQKDADDFAAHLLTEYPTIAHPTASADQDGVYAISPAETDDLGREIGGNNQYGIRLQFGGSTTDGKRKRKLVVIAGIHAAGEQQCWWPFYESIKWLLDSSDTEAANLRANWDVYLYFLINPNGVRGGNSRRTFRHSVDPNRDWKPVGQSGALVEVTTVRDTVLADVGSADAFFSWHGDVYSTSVFQTWVWTPDASSTTRGPLMQAMIDAGTTIFGKSPSIATSSSNNTDVWFGRNALGAPVSFDTEVGAMAGSTRAYFQTLGTGWMKTLEAVDRQNLFVSTN